MSFPFRSRGVGAILGLAASGSLSCQSILDLDGYERAGAGGASASSTSGGSAPGGSGPGGGGSGGARGPSCPPLAPEPLVVGEAGLCGVRALDPLNLAHDTWRSPAGRCDGDACDIYYQRGFGAAILCASCPDLPSLTCDEGAPIAAPAGAVDPYVRAFQPELWLASGSPADIRFAALDGCSPGAFTAFGPPVNTAAEERFPAISPDGKVLFFVRGGAGTTPTLHVAHRDDATQPFDTEVEVKGVRDGAPAGAMDTHPEPIWTGFHEVQTLYFASTRLGADVGNMEQRDVFVAERGPGAAFDAPFASVRLVEALSTPLADDPPSPLSPTRSLWSKEGEPNGTAGKLYVVDRGCAPQFEAPSAEPFAAVNSAGDDTAPAFDAAGNLFFARSPAEPSGDGEVLRAPVDASGGLGAPASVTSPELAHVMGASDRDPFPLPDGRLLFVSDRETAGVPKVWVAAHAAPPSRATSEPDGVREVTPFVDAEGDLWIGWGGADAHALVIARAAPKGKGWGPLVESPGLGHQPGNDDLSPRLTADRRTLLFLSARSGGFASGVRSIWAATRESAGSEAWTAFLLPELGSVAGVGSLSLRDDCSIAYGTLRRGAGVYGFDLVTAARKSP